MAVGEDRGHTFLSVMLNSAECGALAASFATAYLTMPQIRGLNTGSKGSKAGASVLLGSLHPVLLSGGNL